jgi:hypothetical protein
MYLVVCATTTAVGVRFMGGAGINSARRMLHGGLALIWCYEVFRSLYGLEPRWNGSQGQPRAML